MEKSVGIVFKSLPFGETSLILDIFTQSEGLQSFIVSGVRKKKKNMQALYQVMQMLEVVYYPSKGDSLRRIKEANVHHKYQHIFRDIPITSLATLMMDFTRQSVKEKEANDHLFEFLFHHFLLIDDEPEGKANYHIYYLLQLCKEIGISPHNNYGAANPYFNIRDGAFSANLEQDAPYYLDEEQSKYLSIFLDKPWLEATSIKMNREMRHRLLDAMVKYYSYHLENFKKPKSLDILKVIFA